MQYAIPNLMRAEGYAEKEIDQTLHDRAYLQNLLQEIADSGQGWDELEAQVDRIRKTGLPLYVGIRETEGRDLRDAINLEAWRNEGSEANAHDPYAVLAKLTCPVLSIYGECDASVPVAKSVEVFKEALDEAGNSDYTIKVFSKANHGVRVGDDYAEGYLDFMISWLRERLFK
jgi:pimeloyl-ACP methyl ester carboxylesterase